MKLYFSMCIKLTLFGVLITIFTGTVHADNDYDLSGHPIYQEWEYNPDRNVSSERYSSPKASNEYHLIVLSPFIDPDFDPTIRYNKLPVSTFDYCSLEQFTNYPKCMADNRPVVEPQEPPNYSHLFEDAGLSYNTIPQWMISNLHEWIENDNVSQKEIITAIEQFAEE